MVKRLDYILCIVFSVLIMFFFFIRVIHFYQRFSEDDFEAQALTSFTLIVSCLLMNFLIIYSINRRLDNSQIFKRWVKSIGITAAGGAFIFWMYGIYIWITHA